MNRKVLIVDDEPAILKSFAFFLEKAGFETARAESCAKAHELLLERDFSVVVTDIRLGELDGTDLLKRVRAIDPDIPVILVTGQPSVQSASEGIRLGAFDYLTKPVEKAQLIRVVEKALVHFKLLKSAEDLGRQLEQREKMFLALLNAIQESVILMDKKGKVLFANQICANRLEVSTEQLLGKNIFDFMSGETSRQRREWLQLVIKTKKPFTADDKRDDRYFSLSAYPVLDEFGEVQNVALYARDITKDKEAEASLKWDATMNHLLADISDKVLNRILSIDDIASSILKYARDITGGRQGFISVEANPEFRYLKNIFLFFGWKQCELKDKVSCHPEVKNERICRNPETTPGTVPQGIPALPEGHPEINICAVAPIIIQDVRIGQLVVANKPSSFTTKDFDALDRLARIFSLVVQNDLSEEALKKSEAKYRALVEGANDGIMLIDISGNILEANKWFLNNTGYGFPELKGKHISRLLKRDSRQAIFSAQKQILRGRPVRIEVEVSGRENTFWAETIAQRVGINRVQVMIRDITGRKNLERLREEVERMARHDLKTPLNAIINLPELIKEDPLTDLQKEYLSMIQRSGYRMLKLINMSMDLYKMETGSYEFHPLPIDLADIVKKVVVEAELQASARGITIETRMNGSRKLMAMGEDLLSYSMLANIITNAEEASPKDGTITVTLAAEGGKAVVTVHNQGEVPEEIREDFFKKYVTKGKKKGTGLGTYSARLMARVQKGEITMDTSSENGTTIKVFLPQALKHEGTEKKQGHN